MPEALSIAVAKTRPLRAGGLTPVCSKASVNHGLLRYAATQLPAGTTLEVAELDGIPMYNTDLESPAFPESVQRLRAQVAGAFG